MLKSIARPAIGKNISMVKTIFASGMKGFCGGRRRSESTVRTARVKTLEKYRVRLDRNCAKYGPYRGRRARNRCTTAPLQRMRRLRLNDPMLLQSALPLFLIEPAPSHRAAAAAGVY